jgi:hypothetical protein
MNLILFFGTSTMMGPVCCAPMPKNWAMSLFILPRRSQGRMT